MDSGKRYCYGSTYISPGKKLTSGTHRLIYLMESNIRDYVPSGDEKYFFETAKKLTADKRKTGRLERDRLCNNIASHEMERLRGRHIIFIDGESKDNTRDEHPGCFCLDFMSRNCKTSDDILGIYNSLAVEHKYNPLIIKSLENIVFYQVSPYNYAFYEIKFVENEKSFIEGKKVPVMFFCFRDVMDRVSEMMKDSGKETFGTLEKKFRDKSKMIGNFSYSPMLYVPEFAKKMDYTILLIEGILPFLPEDVQNKLSAYNLEALVEDESSPEPFRKYQNQINEVKELVNDSKNSILEISTRVNTKIQARNIENAILKKLGTQDIVVHAKETGYVWKILNYIKGYNFKHTKPMRNTRWGKKGLNEPGAVSILHGYIKEYAERI